MSGAVRTKQGWRIARPDIALVAQSHATIRQSKVCVIHLQPGMYVRCPLDGRLDQARIFALGQILRLDEYEESAYVTFHDPRRISSFYDDVPESRSYHTSQIRRCCARLNSIVDYRGTQARVLEVINQADEGFHVYGILPEDGAGHLLEIPEKELAIPLTEADYSPLDQVLNYEFHSPVWYKNRCIVSETMHILDNAVFGIKALAGCRVHLLPHQIASIVRCLSDSPFRYLLADEVGLGKTIEAAGILKILSEQEPSLQSLIVVPRALVDQWKTELLYKFKILARDWTQTPTKKVKANRRVVIATTEQLASEMSVADGKWGLCIIDEAHRLLGDPAIYERIMLLGQQSRNLLLLSATPIQSREHEYLRLLALLDPDRYGSMEMETFRLLIEQQRKIQRRVYSLYGDLAFFSEAADDMRSELLDMADELRDGTLRGLASQISGNNPGGKDQVGLCLSYLGEHYRFERRIIRNRRELLSGIVPKRKLESYPYDMAGSELFYYESNAYEALVDWAEKYLDTHDGPDTGGLVRRLFASFFSSPWAFVQTLHHAAAPNAESVATVARDWLSAVEAEHEQMERLLDCPDEICGRLMRVLDYVDQQLDGTKMVVFTQFAATLYEFEDLMLRRLGPGSFTVFHAGLSGKGLAENADRFQRDPECRVMLCDELGGEGRNLQIADQVIHIDLPWRADQVEQRIGRLDRIGRGADDPVLSVVFYAQDTVEHQLFRLWDEGLDVFRHSLSGLEIVLGDLNREISKALATDVSAGLTNAVESIVEHSRQMREAVREEQYFDTAAIIYRPLHLQLERMIDTFRKNDGNMLHSAMMSWASMVGLKHSVRQSRSVTRFNRRDFGLNSAANALLVPPDWNRYSLDAALIGGNSIEGTFSRDLSIVREDLLFFAPGDPVFDSIIENAISSPRGRASAFAEVADFDWIGLVLRWSIAPDTAPIRRLGQDVRHLTHFRACLPLGQIITLYPLDEASSRVDRHRIIDQLRHGSAFGKDLVHLGSRKDRPHLRGKPLSERPGLEWFRDTHPPDEWREVTIAAYSAGLADVRTVLSSETDISVAEDEIRRILSAEQSASMYYGRSTDKADRLQSTYSAVLEGIQSPVILLDSMAFAQFVNCHE